jgi:hypothetical protein
MAVFDSYSSRSGNWQDILYYIIPWGPLIIYCTGGIEEKLGGPLIFFKPERGALKKYRETKEGGL